MHNYPVTVILFILAAALVLAGCTAPATGPADAGMNAVAKELVISINQSLGTVETGLAKNVKNLSESGMSGASAEEVLAANLRQNPWAYSSIAVSRDGIVTASMPKNSVVAPGFNMSGRSQVEAANSVKAPLVGNVFRMEEGHSAVFQSYPVFSPSGEYLGYVDITYAPEVFLGRIIGPVVNQTGYDVCVIQADGTEIYDVSREQIGKNVLTDPVYSAASVRNIAERIVNEPSGSGNYTFWDRDWNRNTTKTAVWRTAGIGGASWRVVVIRADSDSKTVAAPVVKTAPSLPIANLTASVQQAAVYAREQGKEAALRAFNNRNGSFVDGEQYIFAYEMNGTVLALPYQQGLIGTNRAGITDSNGVKFIDRLAEVARDGGGPVYYLYPNPADNFREEFKYAYSLPAGDGWFVGSGIYLPGIPARFNASERDALVARVKQARDYAQAQGAAKAIAAFNDRNGTFADGSRYIFAYGMNGTTLALPIQPEVIGTNRWNFTDSNGVRVTAWESSVAQSGGGFVYVEYLNPDTGKNGLKLCFVAPVDDTWFVGSGIYADRE